MAILAGATGGKRPKSTLHGAYSWRHPVPGVNGYLQACESFLKVLRPEPTQRDVETSRQEESAQVILIFVIIVVF